MSRNAVSPLMPRSPSNQNIGSPSRPISQSLAMRKSISKPSANGRPPDTTSDSDVDYDMAEIQNKAIADKYVKGKQIGEGTYAYVFAGHLKSDPSTKVAIKKFRLSNENDPRKGDGISVDTIREIKYLQEISHPSIVGLIDIFSADKTINMVIEYFPNGNLEELIKDSSISYGAADIKAWMGMLLRGLYYLHSNFILHRDIKPNNLLIAGDGNVKLADFGLARSFGEPWEIMTNVVITLWYRPPELLFGARHYSGAVDVWSVGMVFAELLIRRPYAAAEVGEKEIASGGEIAQIDKICEAVGTPTEDVWPGVSELPYYVRSEKTIVRRDRRFFSVMFPMAGGEGVDLLMAMLTLDPRKRITAKKALEHEWWRVAPRPTETANLPKQGGGAKKMAESEVKKPGELDEERKERFKGIAKKLF